jgi:hypothetical protein
MTPEERLRFGSNVYAYIEVSDQQDLEVLMDAIESALAERLIPYGGFVHAAVKGLRDAIRRAHQAPAPARPS